MAEPSPRKRRLRRLIAALALLLLALAARPVWHLASTAWKDEDTRSAAPAGAVEDASRMELTSVAEIVDVPADPRDAERTLAAVLARAREKGLRVSIGGARHSMGGHIATPGGIFVNMLPLRWLELDADRRVLRAGAGALWSDIIPYLNARGLSPWIMQSNDSFSVGGSISVNCHGWQTGRPPIGSSVESFRLMRADGAVVRCSREENAELFSLALGGYGLFGIILDAELRVVANERYRLDRHVVPIADYVSTFAARVRGREDVGMAYGRLCIDPGRFLSEGILNVFTREAGGDAATAPLPGPALSGLKRAVFRGSVGSDYGKKLRWNAETRLEEHLAGGPVWRNQLLFEGVDLYENREGASTDILHEYFVSEDRFLEFLARLREIVPRHRGDLLNVTVRDVRADPDTVLRWADRDLFALVMLFHQQRTAEGEAAMQAMTRDLIDAAIELGGRYYLPYRPHATVEQFDAAYPMGRAFFDAKRRLDPVGLFQNRFYERYGAVR